MPLLTIEILSKPDERVENIERTLRMAARSNNIDLSITHTHDFRRYSHHAINPSVTPIVIIEGNVEFAGKGADMDIIKRRLAEIAFK